MAHSCSLESLDVLTRALHHHLQAKEIHFQYLSECAPEQVNIPAKMREPIDKCIEDCAKVREAGKAYVIPSNLFDEARGEAFALTEKDTFRWVKLSTIQFSLVTMTNTTNASLHLE